MNNVENDFIIWKYKQNLKNKTNTKILKIQKEILLNNITHDITHDITNIIIKYGFWK